MSENDNKDMEEFYDIISNAPPQEDSPSYEEPVRSKDHDEEKLVGKPTQYSLYGPGFLPTGKTYAALPPGCYTTEEINGNVILVPHTFITDEIVVLTDSKAEAIVHEVKQFWTLKDTFKKYGFLHKRGFLMWGPPASGKTVTIKQITDHMVELGGIVIMATWIHQLVDILSSVRYVEPDRPITILLEDLDSMVEKQGEHLILSLLDGENQVENVVFVATTNYPERLGERLLNRPSRFDKIVKIDFPNADARRQYFKAKLGGIMMPGKNGGADFNLVEMTEGFSIAHMRDLIVSVHCQGNDLEDTVKRLKGMKKVPKSSDTMYEQSVGFGS